MKTKLYRLGALLALILLVTGAVFVRTTQAARIRDRLVTIGSEPRRLPADLVNTEATPGDPTGLEDELEFNGTVTEINAELWTIGDYVVTVDASTLLKGDPVVGSNVEVEALVQSDGSYLATSIEVEDSTDRSGEDDDDDSMDPEKFHGVVETIGPDLWMISGQVFVVTADTVIEDGIVVGSNVVVKAMLNADGNLSALKIKLEADQNDEDDGEDEDEGSQSDHVKLHGAVESMDSDIWMISGQAVMVTADTRIEEGVVVGSLVIIKAMINADGSLTALSIKLDEMEDDSGGDDDDEGGSQQDKVKLHGTVDSIDGSVWMIAGQAVNVTGDTFIEEGVVVGSTVDVKALKNADGSLTALKISLDDEHEGDDGGEDHQDQNKVHFSGTVDSMDGNTWTIGGTVVMITGDTQMSDGITIGSQVDVKALKNADGSLTALKIRLEEHENDDDD